MSIKGSPYAHLRAALRTGNLLLVQSAAAELGGTVGLDDALEICLLMDARDDPRFERAAARWLARLVLERPGLGLDELRDGLEALLALGDDPRGSRRALAALCEAHDLAGAARTLRAGT